MDDKYNYWSSSEYDYNWAWYVWTNNGNVNNNNKNWNKHVRPVAAPSALKDTNTSQQLFNTFKISKNKIEHVSMVELFLAYKDCSRHKKSTINFQEFQIDLSNNLYLLYKELNNLSYIPTDSIAFLVHYPKDREIFAANFRDRIVQHLLINRIIHYYEKEVIYDNYSCRREKGTLFGIKRCQEMIEECSQNYAKECYILKMDIKSFFMNINKDLLYECVCDFIDKYEKDENKRNFNKYLSKQIIYDSPQKHCILKQNKREWNCLPPDKSLFNCPDGVGLPIGNITSQIFANLFLDKLDKFITNTMGFEYYGRYVDDFFIINNDKNKLLQAIPNIKLFLESLDLTLHPNKIYIQEVKRGVEFLGTIIKPKRRYVKNRTKGKFYETLEKINNYIEYKRYQLTSDEIQYIQNCVNSYLGYFRQSNSYNLRKKICEGYLFSNLLNFFNIDSNYTKINIKKENISPIN